MAKMSLPNSLLKNAEVADFIYLLINCLLKLSIKVWCLMAHYLPRVAVMSSPWSCSHSTGVNIVSYLATVLKKEVTQPSNGKFHKPAFFKKLTLSPAYTISQDESALKSVQRTFLSSVLPPLCSRINSIKSVWIFSGVYSWLFLAWETQEL